MSFKCQIFLTRLTFHNVLELSCDVRIIILFLLIAILPPNIQCAKLPNPQIRLLINDEDLLREKSSQHEAGGGNVQPEHSGEHFNLYRSELKRLSYETIHRILRDENEPSYRREDTELRYYQKRSPSAYEESHQLIKRSLAAATDDQQQYVALNYSKRKLKEFFATPQLLKELKAASSLDLSDNHLSSFNISLLNEHIHTLNLSNNSFSSIPLNANTSLKTLNLNGNSIQEAHLVPNVYLHNLYLSSNSIENLTAVNLSLLKSLETLDVSCNRLRSLETSFFPERMHNLKHLNMAHNQLGSIYRETFYNLLSLNTLLLGHNNITDIDYETFLALPNLQYLDLSFNRLKGKSIRALQGITGLVALNIAFNAELGPYMQEFVASWSLKELDASGTGLCQIPAALAQSVRSLKLTHNWLKVINCGDLDSYPLLQYLDLSFSHIERIEDDALGRLEILEVLMLDHNHLTKIPVSLPVSLEHLFLQNNNIMDIQSQSFQGLNGLKTLDLSHNKLLYLPDISLPKLQTLNLQSAEIRGISQGIVHTLPRLNELLLEDNPIKCSDLLGIAEWASTCRLRTAKEEVTSTDGAEMTDDAEDSNNEGKIELKKKFQKVHNFYDQFDGECCQRQQTHTDKEAPPPSCALAEETGTETRETLHLREINLKRSSVPALEQIKDENFNLNSMVAIPLPAKKAVQTLTETENKTTPATDDGVNVAKPTPITKAMPPATTATAMQTLTTPMLESNNSKTYILAITSTAAAAAATTTAAATATVPDEAAQVSEEFAFEDKPQEHSDGATKALANAAPATDPADERTAVATTDGATLKAISPQEPTESELESTSVENVRVANMQETLKQIVAETIIKKDIKGQTTVATQTLGMTTQQPPAMAVVDIAESHETAINSPNPEMATAMPTQTLTATKLLKTITRTTPTTTTLIERKAKINLFEAHKENEKEFKTKIGLTDEIIESVETSPIASAPPPATTATTKLSAQTALPGAFANAGTKNSTTATTSRVNSTASTLSHPQPSAATSYSLNTTLPRMSESSPILPAAGGNGAIKQTISETISTTAAAAAATTTTTTSASIKDKTLASNNDNATGQDNGHDNWHGLDNNTMADTLKTTTPITPPHNVVHSYGNHPSPMESQSQNHQHLPAPSSGQLQQDIADAAIHQSTATTSKDVNSVKCTQSNECTSATPQSQDAKKPSSEDNKKALDIGKMPEITEQTQTPADILSPASSATTASTVTAPATATATSTTTAKPNATTHKHEPIQLHIKDRHLIGTPLLMHKGDNLMVAADEFVKPNGSQDSHKASKMTPTPATTTTTASTPSTTPPEPSPPPSPLLTTSPIPSLQDVHELKRKTHTLDKSQYQKYSEPKTSKDQRHHEPLEHKGETIKDKDYVHYKKSNADMKAKKPSLTMKKMTIITKQHVAVTGEEPSHVQDENEIHHQKDIMNDGHYQELKPLHKEWDEATPKHSTVNTPINKESNLQREPRTFQHEHELMLQQILHDQQQQQQHGKATQSEQWSDLRKTNGKENHPGLILLVSSGLFVVLLLGLMHVYRCDVPWRRTSPAHHLRPHQRHNGSVEDDVHSFLSYNEGMQKWHHSTRQEAPYSSPLHNLHVRELQKTSATEKAAIFKGASSYNRHLNRTHILPRTNSQSSSATTRTTSPSTSAILDDETFYIEMTPATGQFAQALQPELLPMELLNMAQTTRQETKETSADYQFAMDEDADLNAPTAPTVSAATSHYLTARSDLLTGTPTSASAATSFDHSNKTLYNTRKFGLW